MKQNKKNGRPYKLSLDDHRDLIRRKAAGQDANELATLFRIGLHTVYEYLKLDPNQRRDA
jgi:DNA invertase Pin-like site-specific DNA recombinase